VKSRVAWWWRVFYKGQLKIGVVRLLNLWMHERVPVHELEVT